MIIIRQNVDRQCRTRALNIVLDYLQNRNGRQKQINETTTKAVTNFHYLCFNIMFFKYLIRNEQGKEKSKMFRSFDIVFTSSQSRSSQFNA